MKAVVKVTDSFDKRDMEFSREWESGAFEEFFLDEGKYIDKLCSVLQSMGEDGDKFSLCFEVEVTK